MTQIKHGPRDAQPNRLLELQQQIADENAKLFARLGTDPVSYDSLTRRVVSTSPRVVRALEYLHLRNLIEYSEDGKLVRFVEEGK